MELNPQAHMDNAEAVIQAVVPNLGIKLFGREYKLKKVTSDWFEAKAAPDGENLYDYLKNYGVSQAGDTVYQDCINNGFNSVSANYAKSAVRGEVASAFDAMNPFPLSASDDKIDESRTYSWDYSLSVASSGLDFTILPEFDPPTVGDWIEYINDNGFDGFSSTLEGSSTGTLNVNYNGGDWSGGIVGFVRFDDEFGFCDWGITLGLIIEVK